MNEALQKKFLSLLLKRNASVNLTSITDHEEAWVKHIEDSLTLLPHLGNARRLIDLGSGGGFPGIPLNVERPGLHVVLVEATRKKVSFLEAAIAELKLQNIRAVWGRAESPDLALELGTFDIVTSRATWRLKDFANIGIPYLGPKGKMIAMKGPKWKEEMKAAEPILKEAGLILHEVIDCTLSNGDRRSLVILERS